MKFEGGCYCGALRYAVDGEATFKTQCHCRECQYMTGGAPNFVMGLPASAFRYTKGAPKQFTRSDIPNPVTREFCANCGAHVGTHTPRAPGMFILKVGTMDDPRLYGAPAAAIFLKDKQAFHHVADGIAAFEGPPGR